MIYEKQYSQIRTYIHTLNTFAVPLIVQFVANYTIGLTDQAIIGRISIEAYGVIGVINAFNYMILGIAGSISIILNIRAGNAFGTGNDKAFKNEFITSILLGSFIGLLLLIGTIFFKKFILEDVYGFHDAALSMGVTFFTILSPYGLLQLLIFIFGQYFKIRNNTRWLLIGSFTSSIVNLILDYLFVLGGLGFPGLGVAGAAASTIIAMLLNLFILIAKSKKDVLFEFEEFSHYCSLAKEHLLESIPLMGQEILEGSVFVVIINSIITRIGVIELSVYLILQQLLSFLFVPMNMYSSATLTLISQNKDDRKELNMFPKVSCLLSMLFYGFIAIIFLALRNTIPKIITTDLDAIQKSSKLFLFAILTNCVNPLSSIYKNALTSVGESKFILYRTAVINMIVIIIAIISTFIFGFGLKGILFCSFFNGLCLSIIYYKKYNRKINGQ